MAKKKKGFTDYLAKTAKGMWANAKGVAKRDISRVKTAIGQAPVGIKPLKADSNMKLKDVELNRIKDIGK